MKWEGNRESDNVEDRRGGGGGSPIFGGRSIGIGTIVIALLGGWALGINPLSDYVANYELPGADIRFPLAMISPPLSPSGMTALLIRLLRTSSRNSE